jgi:nitroreductase
LLICSTITLVGGLGDLSPKTPVPATSSNPILFGCYGAARCEKGSDVLQAAIHPFYPLDQPQPHAFSRRTEKFFNLRRSVRQFAAEPVTHEEIERAVRMAQRAPSVCNRQGAKVYAYTETAERSLVLSFQDGNEGFGNEASVVFVVTSDMSIFYKNGERNQAFVDGGLFAMALVFALHALGLGSCMLNWSKSPRQDASLRRALGIPESEVVVTLLVAGRLLPDFSVAASPRRSLGEVLKWGLGESGP